MNTNRIKNIVLVLFVGLIIGCEPDDPIGPTNKELAFEKLAGTWKYGTNGKIILDGQDVSLNYPGFTLSFTDGTYTTTNGGDLFRATGTWAWVNEAAGSVNLDTGEEVIILELSLTHFKFSFTHTGGGVAAGTSGNYTVSLEK
ncbi:hypothetical protein EV198_3436 [Roseivirga ehrenbergii]|uniref:Lipocalin-like domain-containing protein n=1 Tax=Roseivirga ehrenbergii (strain DSM 102268 / JCM 13514 / KCTC 12282 / NCIMB 14502 / KMM 6017) TaxID=279360 RepID=A0A150WXY7_ROSEK|nr:hypothetical protein [Roseivirga ehrenbergii]KYG71349.1 hypothetical protein MB14_11270 [Roseivirga ehrenbergii]TCK99606.1 hypothetical protein EV198_3436 [Roseivirga ehrenbergii]